MQTANRSAVSETHAEIAAGAPTDPHAFLAWTATLAHEYEGYKIELANGRVTRMMINVKRGHVEVCWNIIRMFALILERGKYLVSSADLGVKVRNGVRYPDVLVEHAGGDRQGRASEHPIFIAEVLSPSTTSVDFLQKLPEYTALASLQTYLICSQDEPVVWLMARDAAGKWPNLPAQIMGLDASVPVSGLGIDMPMSEIYYGIGGLSGV